MHLRKFGKEHEALEVVRSYPFITHCRHVQANTIIHKGPCIVTGITVSGEGAVGDADIYDGESGLEELKFHIEVIAGTTFGPNLFEGTDFDKGIYVAVNLATTHVTVQYSPEDWHHYA